MAAGEGSAQRPTRCAELFSMLPSRLKKDRVSGWDTRFLFEISGPQGGTFTVHIHDGTCDVQPGRVGEPRCTVKTDDATYIGIAENRIRPEMAFMSGKIRLDNLPEMMRFLGAVERLRP